MSTVAERTPPPGADPDAPVDAPPATDEATWRSRLLGAPMPRGWRGWVGPVATAALAAGIRFPNLGSPHKLVFDETYYVKQAYTLWQVGYERRWPNPSDESFTAGTPDIYLPEGDFPVHPPVGKWMIALGEMMFGIDSSFGWRFAAALCGVLMVFLVARVATRLFRSAMLGGIAGLLLAVDGHHIVHSRTSLLDIFVAFWGIVAFAAVLEDRDHFRSKLARALARGASPGVIIWWRPWRILTAISLGMMIGTKWSGLYFLAVLGIFTVLWEWGARRTAGADRPFLTGFLRDGVIAFLYIVPLTLVVYVLSWGGWLASNDAYLRNWGTENPDPGNPLPNWARSLIHYHDAMWQFHINLNSEHDYQANPWAWIIQWRPTSFFYESPNPAQEACGADSCSWAILSLGNVAIWWAGGLALFVAAYCWFFRRDWRAGALLTGIIAGYLPWFLYQGRTIYAFYAVAFEAFLILALTYTLGLVLGSDTDSAARRRVGALCVTAFLVVVVLVAGFFMPLALGQVVTYDRWQSMMWFPNWI